MTSYVVLLRGINVGKAHQLPMPRLRELLTEHGYGAVRTHLRSGNVVLDSDRGEQELGAEVRRLIEAEFGFEVPVVVRTAAEIAAVVAGDPFATEATDPARYLVTFFPQEPPSDKVDALPKADSGDYLVRGRELYLWLPDGVANTPLAAWNWDRLLGVAGTARNWNTVTALAALAADGPERSPERR